MVEFFSKDSSLNSSSDSGTGYAGDTQSYPAPASYHPPGKRSIQLERKDSTKLAESEEYFLTAFMNAAFWAVKLMK